MRRGSSEPFAPRRILLVRVSYFKQRTIAFIMAFDFFHPGGAVFDAGAGHARGNIAIPQLHLRTCADTERIRTLSTAVPADSIYKCRVARMEGLHMSCAMVNTTWVIACWILYGDVFIFLCMFKRA